MANLKRNVRQTVLLLFLILPLLLALLTRSRTHSPAIHEASSKPVLPQHAYHKDPPTEPLPATLDPFRFKDDKGVFVAYALASKVAPILYQEPCYCPCDKLRQHKSLLDCFTGTHGAECRACRIEAMFIYELRKAGKTPSEIRDAMERGDVWKMDFDDYVKAHYAEQRRTTRPMGTQSPVVASQP
jgi:uncharacterized protein with PCYCGC motif